MAYLSSDETREDTHPCAYTVKIQTHRNNTSTYKEIQQSSSEERNLWNAAMVKKLQYLRDLGSFKMVTKPRGANILQSTWAFKKKR